MKLFMQTWGFSFFVLMTTLGGFGLCTTGLRPTSSVVDYGEHALCVAGGSMVVATIMGALASIMDLAKEDK